MFARAAPSFASRRRVTPAKASLGWAVYWLAISFCHTVLPERVSIDVRRPGGALAGAGGEQQQRKQPRRTDERVHSRRLVFIRLGIHEFMTPKSVGRAC